MEFSQILNAIFSENGLFATLFVGLVIWILKTNDEREKRYINTIDNLTTKVSEKIVKIEDDISEIKDAVKK